MIQRWVKRLAERVRLALTSDRTFLENAYRQILGREIDQDGFDYYSRRLREGESRVSLLIGLVRSEEFLKKVLPEANPIPDIRARMPSHYRIDVDSVSKATVPIFEVADPSDFDWLESMLVENGYYERPGVWNFDIDVDKKVMAEMMSAFAPERAMEMGCASGAVLQCLEELGIFCEGVEISRMAIEKASPQIAGRIHRGELPLLELDGDYCLVFGLDIFEHINPNGLDRYIEKIVSILKDGGYLFCNVPAFGADPVFGTVFPFYLDGWDEDAARGRLLKKIHVDAQGYPLHGHLIWAASSWWVERFSSHGLARETEIERAFHRQYDAYFDTRALARKAFYVFSKKGDPDISRTVAQRIGSTPSRALGP